MKIKVLVFIVILSRVFNANAQILNYSIGLGSVSPDFNEYQFSFEAQPKYMSYFSTGLKWRFSSDTLRVLLVEGFGRMYFSTEKSYQNNDRWYLQGKIGYSLIQPTIGYQYNTEDKIQYSYLYGLGLGYKFLLGKLLTFDFYMGYGQINKPIFESNIIKYNNKMNALWDRTYGIPVDLNMSVGFILE